MAAIAAQEGGAAEAANSTISELIERFPVDFAAVRQEGWAAFYRGDLAESILSWRIGVARFPDDPHMPHGLALALRGANRMQDSDAVLATAVTRFPDDAQLRIDQGWNAIQRGSWAEASSIWQEIRARDADCAAAWHAGGIAARHAGDLDEADRLFAAATLQFPDDPLFLREHAQLATHRQDWPEAARRWEVLRTRFPDEKDAYVSGGISLLRAGLHTYADRVLTAAVSRFPDNFEATIEHVCMAIRRHELGCAVSRCDKALLRFSNRPEPYALGINVRLRLGDIAAAEALAQTGMQRFPGDSAIHLEGERVRNQRVATQPAAATKAADVPLVANPPELIELMMEFESLGQNCEFGVVQRHFGAEPLGLFRFTGISAVQVATALNDDLRGIGRPECTYLAVADNGEYLVRDTRYFMNSHTFHHKGAVDHDRLLAGQCRKIGFLAERFLENLKDAPKIYVFRAADPLPDAPMLQLHRALRRHSDATLLVVRTVFGAEGEPAAGLVQRLGDTLFVGHVSRLGQLADGTANTDFDEWLAICRTVFLEIQGRSPRS